MVRDTAPIGEDVQIGTNTPPVETTLEALIRSHNRQPLNTDLTDGQLLKWNATTGKLEGADSGAQTVLRLRAADLIVGNGTPSQATQLRWPSWLLDAAASEGVNGVTRVPDDWNTLDIVVVLANAGAGAGDVSLRGDYELAGVGDTLGGAFSIGAYAAYTVGAQNVITEHTLRSGVAVATDRNVMVQIIRGGANAADTLPNDVGLLAVELRKAS